MLCTSLWIPYEKCYNLTYLNFYIVYMGMLIMKFLSGTKKQQKKNTPPNAVQQK